jgi:hypothetical protein
MMNVTDGKITFMKVKKGTSFFKISVKRYEENADRHVAASAIESSTS